VPNSWVQVPDAAVAGGRRRSRDLARDPPQRHRIDADFVERRARARTPGPANEPPRVPVSSARGGRAAPDPPRNRVCTRAKRKSASVPGRIAKCSSARRAVSVRRGSTTTSLAPRARSARKRFGMPGAVIKAARSRPPGWRRSPPGRRFDRCRARGPIAARRTESPRDHLRQLIERSRREEAG